MIYTHVLQRGGNAVLSPLDRGDLFGAPSEPDARDQLRPG